ncbi:hypothetical protein FPQ18DRAFT_326766 [Pyronema domesticum]|nr:hypothetical protein FPQ18DRAFT_326766 [Pyronema domesticum]
MTTATYPPLISPSFPLTVTYPTIVVFHLQQLPPSTASPITYRLSHIANTTQIILSLMTCVALVTLHSSRYKYIARRILPIASRSSTTTRSRTATGRYR